MATQHTSQSTESDVLYWQEALRLSELVITEQNNAITAIERKAILLITLYTAIIAYLLSGATNTEEKVAPAILVIVAILIVAAWLGALALLIRNIGIPGAEPRYLKWEGFHQNFPDMASNLLDRYEERLALNKKVLINKTDYLKCSMWWGGVGIAITSIWFIHELWQKM